MWYKFIYIHTHTRTTLDYYIIYFAYFVYLPVLVRIIVIVVVKRGEGVVSPLKFITYVIELPHLAGPPFNALTNASAICAPIPSNL